MLQDEHTIEVTIHKDENGLLLKTRDADGFYLALNEMAVNGMGSTLNRSRRRTTMCFRCTSI
jgi:hypothetical protein